MGSCTDVHTGTDLTCDLTSQLTELQEHSTSKPKVARLILTAIRQFFSLPGVNSLIVTSLKVSPFLLVNVIHLDQPLADNQILDIMHDLIQ